MYFNDLEYCSPQCSPLQPPKKSAIQLPASTAEKSSQITVLESIGPPVNKRFYIGDSGKVEKQNFQDAYHYDVHVTTTAGIDDLARLIEYCSRSDHLLFIHGLPKGGARSRVRRLGDNFPEPPNGSQWVMLDFDNIPLPEGIDPLSLKAIEWVIQRLPAEFHGVSYFYQHSASAGILREDGTLLKSGLNVHLFFWLSRPVCGEILSAYLRKCCMDTGFYKIEDNKGGVAMLVTGIDPAPIRSSVQPHFISAPKIEDGVRCLLQPSKRQGLIRKAQNDVALPPIGQNIQTIAKQVQDRLVGEYKRQHGYVTKSAMTQVGGRAAVTRYSVAPDHQTGGVRKGRELAGVKLSEDGKFLTLFFADEGSPGSWYVCKDRPQLSIRHGDGACLPLKELSDGAHRYVRDELRWFSEVPHHDLELIDGYVPSISSFAKAKMSLVLAPTSAGKTSAAIVWIREQIAERKLVLYAAPTVALVNQMRDDLMQAGLSPSYYTEVMSPFSMPRTGVIVTTNDSLPRLLKYVYGETINHVLIFDEIHQGLDWFMGSERHLKNFENALSKAGQSLLLTGTLTDVQRIALVEEAKQSLGCLTEQNYCCYEFTSQRRNPLEIVPTDFFDSDLASLFANFQAKLKKGETLPRFVLLIDTSKMQMYRSMVDAFGLSEQAMIVSRPECSEEEIEAARTSTLPILISSPLFGLGLNFKREPDILWARFDHVSADTNQIIQTVNRANRRRLEAGEIPCQVCIYGNVIADANFNIPDREKLKAEVRELVLEESSLAGLLQEHLHVDRATYRLLREAERNSQIALSVLVRENAIQNFDVVEAHGRERNKLVEGMTKDARRAAKQKYDQDIIDAAEPYAGYASIQALVALERLDDERGNNWKSREPRTERDLENEKLGVLVGWLEISPAEARKVNTAKVQRLFGNRSLWLSGQFVAENYSGWAKVAAEKTDKLIVLLEKLDALRRGEIDAEALSASLTRNKQLGEAFLALVGSEVEYLNWYKELERLKTARDELRSKGGKDLRAEVSKSGLVTLRELLEPLGVTYEKKTVRGRQVTDNTKPIVPAAWNIPEMILMLRRQAARLQALPVDQKVSVQHFEVPDWADDSLEPIPRQLCEGCVFFHENDCSVGKYMDWQSSSPKTIPQCSSFKGIKIELRLV